MLKYCKRTKKLWTVKVMVIPIIASVLVTVPKY